MLLAVNIIFILMIIRLLLNNSILKALLAYRWDSILNFQHLCFAIIFTSILLYTGKQFAEGTNYLGYVFFLFMCDMGIYYLVFRLLVPKYYLANRYASFILTTLLLFLISSLFFILLLPVAFDLTLEEPTGLANFIYLIYSIQGFVILMAAFLGISKDKIRIEKDYTSLAIEKEQIQMDLLKSKLSPHFLLNTLHNIYVQSFTPSEETPSSILQLSRLLQYIIYDSSTEKVDFAKELSIIKALHALYQMKFKHALNITYDIQHIESLNSIEIPPAICLTLFENALKHSAIGIVPESYIHLSFTIEHQSLAFEIHNSISSKALAVESGYNGLGKKTVLKILNTYYGNQYTLLLEQTTKNEYLTRLTINML